MNNSKGPVTEGARLVLRHQRILWWVFAVNAVLALLSSSTASTMFSGVLDHSNASGEIAGTLQVARLYELTQRPEIAFPAAASGTMAAQAVFFVFMLFVTGGILFAYRDDGPWSRAAFFESCGRHFWRIVRLTLISIIPFGICLALYRGIAAAGNRIADATPIEAYVFLWRLCGGVLVIVLLLCVKFWFDIAQVRAVAKEERSMWRNTFRTWGIVWRRAASLFWMYLRISIVAWLALCIGFWAWMFIPGRAFFLSFLLLEIVMLVQLAVRLWLRAASVAWYRMYAEDPPVVESLSLEG